MKTTFSEAIKIKDGIVYNLAYHQARVDRTLAVFGGQQVNLRQLLADLPDSVREGLFKCRLVYGKQPESLEFIPYVFRRIESVALVVEDEIDYGYKFTDRRMLEQLLKQSGQDEIIIVKQGLVTDASSSNLVFESSEGLFTPDSCLLQGTKRQCLIDTGRISEKRISVEDIHQYDSVRFINAMVDLEDEIRIDICRLMHTNGLIR